MSTKEQNELTVEEKLAAIAEAMNKKPEAKIKAAVKVACPIDPAERALCEGCQ